MLQLGETIRSNHSSSHTDVFFLVRPYFASCPDAKGYLWFHSLASLDDALRHKNHVRLKKTWVMFG